MKTENLALALYKFLTRNEIEAHYIQEQDSDNDLFIIHLSFLDFDNFMDFIKEHRANFFDNTNNFIKSAVKKDTICIEFDRDWIDFFGITPNFLEH